MCKKQWLPLSWDKAERSIIMLMWQSITLLLSTFEEHCTKFVSPFLSDPSLLALLIVAFTTTCFVYAALFIAHKNSPTVSLAQGRPSEMEIALFANYPSLLCVVWRRVSATQSWLSLPLLRTKGNSDDTIGAMLVIRSQGLHPRKGMSLSPP